MTTHTYKIKLTEKGYWLFGGNFDYYLEIPEGQYDFEVRLIMGKDKFMTIADNSVELKAWIDLGIVEIKTEGT